MSVCSARLVSKPRETEGHDVKSHSSPSARSLSSRGGMQYTAHLGGLWQMHFKIKQSSTLEQELLQTEEECCGEFYASLYSHN